MWYSLVRIVPATQIFIRPRIVLFLSVITLFFFLANWSKAPEMLKAHVTLKDIKRVVRFTKGETVQGLRYGILREFSELLLDTVGPACVQIQEHDATVGDDVDLPVDLKLEEDVKVKVKLPTKQDETALCNFKISSAHGITSWIKCSMQGNEQPVGPIVPHPINSNVPYRLWSPVYGGSLLQRGDNNVVKCGGAFTDKDYDTVLTSESPGGHHFAFIFKENAGKDAKKYVLNAKSKDQLVATNPVPRRLNNTMKFTPHYYWSFTLFKNEYYNTLYLGCGSNGESFLVPMNTTQYPDPRALFIVNKYVVKLSI